MSKKESRKSVDFERTSSNASPKPTRARTAVVKRAVLDAAAKLFAERGFAGATLRDIADTLGMSRPGLYYHFPNKEALLEAIVEEVTLSSMKNMQNAAQQALENPLDALRMLLQININWTLEHSTLFRLLDRIEGELPKELFAKHTEAKRTILEQLTEIIDRGVLSGQFRPVDPRMAAFALIGMSNWTAWWFKAGQGDEPTEIAGALADFGVSMLQRSDPDRSRSSQAEDVLRILKEDVAHLEIILKSMPG